MKNKVVVFIICNFLLVCFGYSQGNLLKLQDAIKIAQENSFEFKIAKNRYQASVWRYMNYKSSFLPSFYLSGNIPEYTRAISKITLPTGEDTFVGQNQSYSSLNLGVRQNVGLTGGVLSFNSFLNRIDVFGNQRQTRYSSTPFSISYSQEVIGYNSFRWKRKMEPQFLLEANRQLLSDMERIAGETVIYYFDLLSAKNKYRLSKQNLANVDTLYRITNDRFKLGTIDQSNLLQIKLNKINTQRQCEQDSINFNLIKKKFIDYLRLANLEKTDLVFDEKINFFDIPQDQAMSYLIENSHFGVSFSLKKLQSEQDLAQTKAQNGLKFNINANFGITNTSTTIRDILSGVENQQQVSIGFTLPILDWGYARTQKQRSEANVEMVKSEIEQQRLTLEQEISLYLSQWDLQKKQLSLGKESLDISTQNYQIELSRFLRGTITLNDLNIAQQQKDNASVAYLEVIKGYWTLYYNIRRLTLYDFETKTNLNVNLNSLQL